MTEKILVLSYCVIVILLFALNFNHKWADTTYEKIKPVRATWYWFRVFKIPETKENFMKFQKRISLFVITIMIISILAVLLK